MGLVERFKELDAPSGFSPNLGVMLSWPTVFRNEKVNVIFDPSCSSGFPLRIMLPESDVAMNFFGDIVRDTE